LLLGAPFSSPNSGLEIALRPLRLYLASDERIRSLSSLFACFPTTAVDRRGAEPSKAGMTLENSALRRAAL
jgi:hypothetical protein